MSMKTQERKKSRQYRTNINEDYGYDKDLFKRSVKKERSDKQKRLAYELDIMP